MHASASQYASIQRLPCEPRCASTQDALALDLGRQSVVNLAGHNSSHFLNSKSFLTDWCINYNMNYLIELHRFELDENILALKINEMQALSIQKESKEKWVIASTLNIKEKLQALPEVKNVVELKTHWNSFSFEKIKKEALQIMKEEKPSSFFIKIKFDAKIAISSTSLGKKISAQIKKEGYIAKSENPSIWLYVELDRQNGHSVYRIGLMDNKQVSTAEKSTITAILENPGSVIEISDFLRLAWVFKIPLIFVVNKSKDQFDFLLKKAQKMTKGISYEELQMKILPDLPRDLVLVGFSKNARDDERELKKILFEHKKIGLLFGDEKFGLSQKGRDTCKYYIHLTPDYKKPMRASHALVYVLGFKLGETI